MNKRRTKKRRTKKQVIEIDSKGCWNLVSHSQNNKNTRKAYIKVYGSIPEGLVIRHKCDNNICVNPDHLEPGTLKQNQQDRIRNNTNPIGTRNGRAKLTEKEVLEIRALHNPGYRYNKVGRTGNCELLSKKYNVTSSLISQIVLRKAWSHI